MSRIVHSPQALEDILKDALYLVEEASEETADRFLDAIDRTLSELAEMPLMGRFLDFEQKELRDVHVWRVKSFEKWLIFYRPIDHGIEVVRVLHGARDLHEALNHTDW